MKTNEERLNELEKKEVQRDKDFKEAMIFLVASCAFIILVFALAFSACAYENTKQILEILKQ